MQKVSKKEIKEAQQDIDLYQSLAAIHQSEGGKNIVNNLVKDIVLQIEKFANNYDSIPEMQLRLLGGDIQNKLTLVRAFSNSVANKTLALRFVEEALKKESEEDIED